MTTRAPRRPAGGAPTRARIDADVPHRDVERFAEYRRTRNTRAAQRHRRRPPRTRRTRRASLHPPRRRRRPRTRRHPPDRAGRAREGRGTVRPVVRAAVQHLRRPHHRRRDQAPLPRPRLGRTRARDGSRSSTSRSSGRPAASRRSCDGRRPSASSARALGATDEEILEGMEATRLRRLPSIDAGLDASGDGERRHRRVADRRRRPRRRGGRRPPDHRSAPRRARRARAPDRLPALLRGADPGRDRGPRRHQPDARLAVCSRAASGGSWNRPA